MSHESDARATRYKSIGVVYYAWWGERINEGFDTPQWDTLTQEERDAWLASICRFDWMDVIRGYACNLRDALDRLTVFRHLVRVRMNRIGALVQITIHHKSPRLDVDVDIASLNDDDFIRRELSMFEDGDGLDSVALGGNGHVYHIVKPLRPRGIDPIELWSKSRASDDAKEIMNAPDSLSWAPANGVACMNPSECDRGELPEGVSAFEQASSYQKFIDYLGNIACHADDAEALRNDPLTTISENLIANIDAQESKAAIANALEDIAYCVRHGHKRSDIPLGKVMFARDRVTSARGSDDWIMVCRHDPSGRRGLWYRLREGGVELCSGREGDDAYLAIEGPEGHALYEVLDHAAWNLDEAVWQARCFIHDHQQFLHVAAQIFPFLTERELEACDSIKWDAACAIAADLFGDF